MNELIFFLYLATISIFLILSLLLGRSAISSMVAVQWILANLFVTKQITLFGWNATASDALAIGATLGLNLVQEEHGKKAARQTITLSFVCLTFYTIISALHLLYQPSAQDVAHSHFAFLLAPMPRLILASLFTSLTIQYIEYGVYGFLSHLLDKRFFLFRNYLSVSITQAIDTLLFGFLGIYGLVSDFEQVMLISYMLKIVSLVITAPFLTLARGVINMSRKKQIGPTL